MAELFWIEREYGERIDGPYTTLNDALRARVWVEKVKSPETFWVRSGAWSEAEDIWRAQEEPDA